MQQVVRTLTAADEGLLVQHRVLICDRDTKWSAPRRESRRRENGELFTFAGQTVGVKQVDEHIWLVTFMHYDLGYFDDQTCRLEPIDNPFGPKLLPMSPAVSVKVVVALFRMPH